MGRWTIRRCALAAFALIAALMTLMGGFALQSLASIREQTRSLDTDSLEGMIISNQMLTALRLTNMGAGTFGPLSRHLGTLAECPGDAALAETHYRAALTAAARMPAPVFSSGISWLYARLLLRIGDTGRQGRATELLSSAFQLATDFDLHSIASVCRSLASHHGVSLERRGAPRERRGVAHETEN